MNSKKSKKLRGAVIIISLIAIVASALVLLDSWDKKRSFFPSDTTDTGLKTEIEFEGKKYILNKNIETVLLMGLDKFDSDEDIESYNNDKQADFLMLFILDNERKTCSAIHINRDTMAQVNVLGVAGQKIETREMQIALSHTYGNGQQVSLRNTADSVSDLLGGIKIDHCVSATMDSVAVLNDLVGGVEVEVLHDFSGTAAELVKGERVLLKGESALTYVRAREGVGSEDNESRMLRQRQYLEALYQNLADCVSNDDDFIVKAFTKLSDYIISNSHTAELQELSKKITTYEFIGIEPIEGEAVAGEEHIEFYPDDEKLKKLIIIQFYKFEN